MKTLGKTIAEGMLEEGTLKGRSEGVLIGKRETLLLQLKIKLNCVSPSITTEIEATDDGSKLNTWLDALITAKKISDLPM